MIADSSRKDELKRSRIAITGIGVAAPNGNNLTEYRENLLNGKSGVSPYEIRYFGKTLAGVCDFDTRKYQDRREIRRGTRACLLYTSPSPRDKRQSRMPSSA